MGKTFGFKALTEKKFDTYELSELWRTTLGRDGVERNFRMLVWGPSGGGKTTFVLHLCSELARHGKVYYNSIEQGEGKSLQAGLERCGELYRDIKPGRLMFGDRDTFEEMVDKIKKMKAAFVMVDSLQYMNLTVAQYKHLVRLFPRKSFIIISWEGAGKEPKGEHAKAIRYMADIKTYVSDGIANCQSRFGATEPYVVFTKAKTNGYKQQELGF